MRIRGEQAGVLAIESLFSMLIFIILMMTFYSMIVLFMAQNLIGHALMQSSQSLALETYATSEMEAGLSLQGLATGFIQLFSSDLSTISNLLSVDYQNDSEYTTRDTWHEEDADTVAEVARQRFASYLAGGAGAADAFLRNLGVIDGLAGVSFDGTGVSGSDLTITIHYRIQLLIRPDTFGFGVFDSEQSVCARLWG